MTKNNTKNRRDFIKSLLSLSAAGSFGSLGQLALMSEALASPPAFSDYKALVCVFLAGGNDSLNMLIPTGNDTKSGYNNYQAIRGDLAVSNQDLDINTVSSSQTDLNNGVLGKGANNPYHVGNNQHSSAYLKGVYDLSVSKGIDLGVNGVMPELAQLITDNKASIIANVGNLVSPVTRTGILNGSASLPLFLFAHNHQQRALQTGRGDKLTGTGWAGRIADHWQGINSSSPLGLNISYQGNNRMLIGDQTAPLALPLGKIPSIQGMKDNTRNVDYDRRAIFKALAGVQNISGTSRANKMVFDGSNTFTTTDPFKQLYGSLLIKSMSTFDVLLNTWDANSINYASVGSYGESLFTTPTNSDLGFGTPLGGKLISQLESVAKMIELGAQDRFSTGGYNRQVFMVGLGGFDTHATQSGNHPLLLRELSLALWKFQKAMEELGHANKVTTFTMSDFGRTVSRNSTGTDHAWGGHHIVMGGDGAGISGGLNGGQMLGHLPDLSLGGDDDYSGKGRTIPSIAQDQLNATLCRWLGVDNALMPTIFPNLTKFSSPSGGTLDSAYLNSLYHT